MKFCKDPQDSTRNFHIFAYQVLMVPSTMEGKKVGEGNVSKQRASNDALNISCRETKKSLPSPCIAQDRLEGGTMPIVTKLTHCPMCTQTHSMVG